MASQHSTASTSTTPSGRPAKRVPPHSKRLLEGKPYRALADHAEGSEADLLVVGRFGRHREQASRIGSNADALVRAAKTNVLVTSSGKPVDESKRLTVEQPAAREVDAAQAPLEWDADVEDRLQRIPPFARPMAKRAIEAAARDAGETRVSMARFEAVARQFGMGGRDG